MLLAPCSLLLAARCRRKIHLINHIHDTASTPHPLPYTLTPPLPPHIPQPPPPTFPIPTLKGNGCYCGTRPGRPSPWPTRQPTVNSFASIPTSPTAAAARYPAQRAVLTARPTVIAPTVPPTGAKIVRTPTAGPSARLGGVLGPSTSSGGFAVPVASPTSRPLTGKAPSIAKASPSALFIPVTPTNSPIPAPSRQPTTLPTPTLASTPTTQPLSDAPSTNAGANSLSSSAAATAQNPATVSGIVVGCFLLLGIMACACFYRSKSGAKSSAHQLWTEWAARHLAANKASEAAHEYAGDYPASARYDPNRASDFDHASVYSGPPRFGASARFGGPGMAPTFVPYVANAPREVRRPSRHPSSFQMQALGGPGPRRGSTSPDIVRNIV